MFGGLSASALVAPVGAGECSTTRKRMMMVVLPPAASSLQWRGCWRGSKFGTTAGGSPPSRRPLATYSMDLTGQRQGFAVGSLRGVHKADSLIASASKRGVPSQATFPSPTSTGWSGGRTTSGKMTPTLTRSSSCLPRRGPSPLLKCFGVSTTCWAGRLSFNSWRISWLPGWRSQWWQPPRPPG